MTLLLRVLSKLFSFHSDTELGSTVLTMLIAAIIRDPVRKSNPKNDFTVGREYIPDILVIFI